MLLCCDDAVTMLLRCMAGCATAVLPCMTNQVKFVCVESCLFVPRHSLLPPVINPLAAPACNHRQYVCIYTRCV
jgi:hypothetical protein